MKAIDGFDLDREVRFSSYATPTVLGEIKRHFRDKTWADPRAPRPCRSCQLKRRQGARQAHARARPLADRPGARRRGRGPVRGGPADAPEPADARRTRSFEEPTGEDSTLGRRDRRRRPRDAAHRDARPARRCDGDRCRPATARSCACASRRTSRRPRSRPASASRRCRSRASSASRWRGCGWTSSASARRSPSRTEGSVPSVRVALRPARWRSPRASSAARAASRARRLAFAFDAPRTGSRRRRPRRRRAQARDPGRQPARRLRADRASAYTGSHSRMGAGSSSTML